MQLISSGQKEKIVCFADSTKFFQFEKKKKKNVTYRDMLSPPIMNISQNSTGKTHHHQIKSMLLPFFALATRRFGTSSGSHQTFRHRTFRQMPDKKKQFQKKKKKIVPIYRLKLFWPCYRKQTIFFIWPKAPFLTFSYLVAQKSLLK